MKPFPSYRIILAILLSLLFFTSFAMSERHYVHAMNIVPHRLYSQYLLARLYEKTGKEDAHRLAEEIVQAEVKTGTTAVYEIRAEMRAYLQWAGTK
jgi:hypothetical protein